MIAIQFSEVSSVGCSTDGNILVLRVATDGGAVDLMLPRSASEQLMLAIKEAERIANIRISEKCTKQ